MANGIDWFRWHHGSVNDEKFKLVARRSGASLPDVLAVWAYILEKSSANDVRGQFSDIDCEAVDCLFDFPATETRTADIVKAMEARGLLLPNRVARWEERQPQRERETVSPSTSRVQKHRAKQAMLHGVSVNETPCNTTELPETPREEKSREEQSKDNDNTVVGSPTEPVDPADLQNPKAAGMPPREDTTPSNDPAIVLTVALRKLGVTALFTHPTVQDWAKRNVQAVVLTQAIAMAREQKGDAPIPVNYLAPIVNKLLSPGSASQPSRPAVANLKFNPNDQDRSADAALMAEGMRRNGITMPAPDEEIDI
jgi:hypothetical protein